MTAKDHERSTDVEALQRLLDVYGADRSRWPARDRLKFAELLAESADARRILGDAGAFDRLLDMAPGAEAAAVGALAGKIAAAASAEPKRAGRSIEAPHAMGATRTVKRLPERTRQIIDWPAAALMAASLVLGVFVGTNGYFDDVTGQTAVVAASGADIDTDASAIAFGGDAASLLEEDLL